MKRDEETRFMGMNETELANIESGGHDSVDAPRCPTCGSYYKKKFAWNFVCGNPKTRDPWHDSVDVPAHTRFTPDEHMQGDCDCGKAASDPFKASRHDVAGKRKPLDTTLDIEAAERAKSVTPTYADLLCEVEVLRQIVKVNGFTNEAESVAPESRDLALIELRRWEEETGEKASASEGNAWIDGFNAGRALRAGAPPQPSEALEVAIRLLRARAHDYRTESMKDTKFNAESVALEFDRIAEAALRSSDRPKD